MTTLGLTAPVTRVVASSPWHCVRSYLPAIAGIVAVLTLSVGIVLLPVDYKALGNYGYIGIFGVTLVATAALVVPVPYLGLIVVAGSFLDPVLVGVVAGVAAALGELTGYVLGRSGRALLPDNRWYHILEGWMERGGVVVILVGATIPNPFFDAIGVVAGASRMRLWQFALPCLVGKTLRFILLASLGGSLPFLVR